MCANPIARSSEEYRKRQRDDIVLRDELAKANPDKAISEARERLIRAGIIDDQGNLVPFFGASGNA